MKKYVYDTVKKEKGIPWAIVLIVIAVLIPTGIILFGG